LGEVAASLGELAETRKVRVEVQAKPERLAVRLDAEQVRIVVGCLLRNAIEAAPADGWARLAMAAPSGDPVEVAGGGSRPGPGAPPGGAVVRPVLLGPQRGPGPRAGPAGCLAPGPAAGRRPAPGADPAGPADALRAHPAVGAGPGGRGRLPDRGGVARRAGA